MTPVQKAMGKPAKLKAKTGQCSREWAADPERDEPIPLFCERCGCMGINPCGKAE